MLALFVVCRQTLGSAVDGLASDGTVFERRIAKNEATALLLAVCCRDRNGSRHLNQPRDVVFHLIFPRYFYAPSSSTVPGRDELEE